MCKFLKSFEDFCTAPLLVFIVLIVFFFSAKIESQCIVSISKKNYYKHCWTIGIGIHRAKVCRKRFMLTYDIKHWYLENLCSQIKKGVVNSQKPLNDATPVVAHNDFIHKFELVALKHGVTVSRNQLCAIQLPNTVDSIHTFGWLNFYFNMVGDLIPNSDNQIHLEPTLVQDIYAEYSHFMTAQDLNSLGRTQFAKLWQTCFPHVSIREYKAVTGKCDTCAKLSSLRRELRDTKGRQLLTELHMLHRSTYMSERMTYANRSQLAMQMPQQHLSLISDGMAQTHCILPWLGNITLLGKGCAQHLQGVLLHGRKLVIYRTFHNINNCANLQIHTFLLTLEDIIKSEGKLPDVVYYQIDGGSENTAKTVFGILELIIARRLTKKIILTRLLVGHTHADIDGVFGRLWKAVRDITVATPNAYRDLIQRSLFVCGNAADVVDLFVVPNYDKIITPCLDPKFGNYAKEDMSILQFFFESVDACVEFPLGCTTTYRAYSSDEVIEIVPDENAVMHLRPVNVLVKTQPCITAKNAVEGAM